MVERNRVTDGRLVRLPSRALARVESSVRSVQVVLGGKLLEGACGQLLWGLIDMHAQAGVLSVQRTDTPMSLSVETSPDRRLVRAL